MIRMQITGPCLALALLCLSQLVLGQSIDSVCYNTAPAPFVSDTAASGADGSYSYLWQDSVANGSWAAAPGANNGLIYQPQALIEKTYYRRQVLSTSCGEAFSNTLTVHVFDLLDSTSTTVTDATCPGGMDGAISIAVTGGLPPYSYAWSSGGSTTGTNSALLAGTYTVSVTDAKVCDTLIYSFQVGEPAPLLASFSVDSTISCFGLADGGATVLASGGTGPYSYLWNNNVTDDFITGEAAGNYTVSVTDALGCGPVAATVNLTEPDLLVATAVSPSFPGGSSISCKNASDGAINTALAGGTAGFTYAWLGPNAFNSTLQNLTALDSGAYTVTVTDTNGCIALDTVVLSEPDSLFISLTAPQFVGGVNVSCLGLSDGAVNLTSTGGSPTLNYSWTGPGGFVSSNQNIASISAGTYQITATDANGCSASGSIALTEPAAALVVSLDVPEFVGGNEVSCYENQDGAVNTLTNGGTAGYAYQWLGSNGFTDTTESITSLGAGTYSVTVTDTNGCVAMDSVTLSQPDTSFFTSLDALTFLGGWNINCNGTATGEIALTALGTGVPGFTYAWSGPNGYTSTNQNISGLFAGEYTVATTDTNGCVALDTLVLTSPDPLVVSVDSVQDVICFGDSNGTAWGSTTGGTDPISFDWDYGFNANTNQASGLAMGTIGVQVTDGQGCVANASGTLGFTFDLPLVELGPDTLIPLPSFTIALPDTFSSYAWSNGSENDFAIVFASGTYSVTVTDGNGCANSDSITISLWATGVEEVFADAAILTYPNPSRGLFSVETPGLETEKLEWIVTSATGKQLESGVFAPNSNAVRGHIDLRDQATGLYFLRINHGAKVTTTRLMVH